LNGTIDRENEAMGFLLALYPMQNLVRESYKYGNYYIRQFGRKYPIIQVISAQEIIGGV